MEQRYIYRRKRRRNNGPLILTLTIALVFGVGGFLIGNSKNGYYVVNNNHRAT